MSGHGSENPQRGSRRSRLRALGRRRSWRECAHRCMCRAAEGGPLEWICGGLMRRVECSLVRAVRRSASAETAQEERGGERHGSARREPAASALPSRPRALQSAPGQEPQFGFAMRDCGVMSPQSPAPAGHRRLRPARVAGDGDCKDDPPKRVERMGTARTQARPIAPRRASA